MPGLAFMLGGYNRIEQHFNITVAQTTGKILLLALLNFMIPSSGFLTDTPPEGIVKQSRGTSVVLLICYGLLMFSQSEDRDLFTESPPLGAETRSTFCTLFATNSF